MKKHLIWIPIIGVLLAHIFALDEIKKMDFRDYYLASSMDVVGIAVVIMIMSF